MPQKFQYSLSLEKPLKRKHVQIMWTCAIKIWKGKCAIYIYIEQKSFPTVCLLLFSYSETLLLVIEDHERHVESSPPESESENFTLYKSRYSLTKQKVSYCKNFSIDMNNDFWRTHMCSFIILFVKRFIYILYSIFDVILQAATFNKQKSLQDHHSNRCHLEEETALSSVSVFYLLILSVPFYF